MKPFRFRLATVLELRQREEDAAQKAVIEAEGVVKRIKGQVSELKDLSQSAEDEFRCRQRSTVSVLTLSDSQAYLSLMLDRIAAKEDELMLAQNTLGKKREALAHAMRERKTIEKLKEKQYAEWKREVARQEAAFLDELGTIRYKNQGGQGFE